MGTSKNKITLMIVDDHEFTRVGIRQILERDDDIEIVGEASNGDEAILLVEQLHPSVLLLDIQMPGTPAREIEKKVRERYPDIITLVLTGHDRDSYLAEFMKLGVSGYLDKNAQANNLIAAIRRAVSGEILFTPDQFKRAYKWEANVGEKWKSLTPREKEIAQLLAQGVNNQGIAEKLFISQRTVYFHVENIIAKLNVETRTQAIAWINKNISEYL